MYYLSANLQNLITTKLFDAFSILTSKQQKFSECDPVLIRQFWKNCSPIQSWSGQNWHQYWCSPIQSCPCSSLLQRQQSSTKLVMCDGSLALIQSVIQSFKENLQSYLDRYFLTVSGQYTH